MIRHGEGLGEFELIDRLREAVAAVGAGHAGEVVLASGDDAAVLRAGEDIAISVDALVEDVHFTRSTFPLRAVGHKAIATALSDLAAMGAAPEAAVVFLGIPLDLAADPEGLDGLAAGMASCAAEHGVAIVGGDVTRAAGLTVSVTVTGRRISGTELIGRAGAVAGDVIAVTGELGGAAAGLLLLAGEAELEEPGASALIARQREPEPRLAAGVALARAGAHAMIDLSDGTGADAAHIARASGARLRIEASALPIQVGVAEVAAASGREAVDLALAGGEDYELLACIPAEQFSDARSAVQGTGVALTRIGEVVSGAEAGVEIRGEGGESLRPSAFDQLRPPGRPEREPPAPSP